MVWQDRAGQGGAGRGEMASGRENQLKNDADLSTDPAGVAARLSAHRAFRLWRSDLLGALGGGDGSSRTGEVLHVCGEDRELYRE